MCIRDRRGSKMVCWRGSSNCIDCKISLQYSLRRKGLLQFTSVSVSRNHSSDIILVMNTSSLSKFRDDKCLSFVMKVNVKMSVRSSCHNCPECVVTVLSYPFSLTLFRSDSICWKLWPYRSRTFALSDVFIHLLSVWMRLLCLKFWFTSCARNLCVRDKKSLYMAHARA